MKAVDAGFDEHHIPYDVIWLDIDHTDQKRYFTWDPALFPEPVLLQRHLEAKKRKVGLIRVAGFSCCQTLNLRVLLLQLVVISDPHIKVDPEWWLYQQARDQDHFIKTRDGRIFQGSCWSGNVFEVTANASDTKASLFGIFCYLFVGESSYLDFSRAHTRAWYSRCFGLDKYEVSTLRLASSPHCWSRENPVLLSLFQGSTPSLFVWIDMNEPSVFDGPEQTVPKDAVHHGGWEHRELHNLYGFYQVSCFL